MSIKVANEFFLEEATNNDSNDLEPFAFCFPQYFLFCCSYKGIEKNLTSFAGRLQTIC